MNLGIRDGSNKLKYNASIGYNANKGVIITSFYYKLTGRFNVDYQVSDKAKWMSRISFGYSKTNGVSTVSDKTTWSQTYPGDSCLSFNKKTGQS